MRNALGISAPLAGALLLLLSHPCALAQLDGVQDAKPIELRREAKAVDSGASLETKQAPKVRVRPDGLPLSLRDAASLPADRGLAEEPIFEPEVEAGAAPPNDSCSTPTVIMGIGSFPFNNAEATTDGNAHAACNFFGQNQIGRDVWFRWRAPASAQFTADTCTGTAFDSKLAVYALAPCPPVNAALLGCNDDGCSIQSRVTFNAVGNQEYLIRVGSFPTNPGGAGMLRIQFTSGQTLCLFPGSNCQEQDRSNAFESTGTYVSDDFTPTSNGFISTLCFWGAYFDGESDCQGDHQDQFRIEYYYDFAGEPDIFPFAEFAPGDYTLTGPVATGNFINAAFPEYAYKITHPGVQVFAGECLWIRIRNELPLPPNGNCAWYWERGLGGNTIAYQGTERIAEDFAFCINIPMDPPTECAAPNAPPNDSCSTPKVLGCGITLFDEDNLFATTAATDPAFTCRVGGSAQGIGTLWYRFTASATSARVTMCNSTGGDTLLALYSGTCGNFTLRACSDDFCGTRSQVCATGLTVGQQYFIQLASYDDDNRGPYTLTLTCPCPAAPANDACANATLLTAPTSVLSNTFNAASDPGIPTCGFSLVSGPGVWYRVVGNGRTYTADTCSGDTTFDTKLSVFCGTCTQLVCVDESDDDCAAQSEVSWCTQNGLTYYIYVHGFSGSVGQFRLNLFTDAVNCSNFESCTTCDLTCPAGSIQEAEPCGQSTNAGCNVNPPEVQAITCGQKVCGTNPSFGVTRDTDWYEFNINTPSTVTWRVQSETPIDALILDDQCPTTVLASATAGRCGTAVATALLAPGTYRAFVGAVGDSYPCGSFSQYIGELTCGAVGACCIASDCFRMTGAQCATAMGVYGGDGTACPIDYNATNCATPFEDVSATGNPIVFIDEEGISIQIGFTFRFFGVSYTSIGVSPNGYLSFDPLLSEQVNALIPSVAEPNAVIAPLWDDLSPESGGTIRYRVLGTAPNRRLVVQWKNVPQFLQTDANTFQAALFEGTNCIEYRYGVFTAQGASGDYTVGVENQSGTDGTSINAASITSNSCRRMCPSLNAGGCQSIAHCPGDATGDNYVSFPDITSVLAHWGGAGPPGDANDDGSVGFPDVTEVLRYWNETCP